MKLLSKAFCILIVILMTFNSNIQINSSASEYKTRSISINNFQIAKPTYNENLNNAMTSAWDSMNETVDVSSYKITAKSISNVIAYILHSYPQYFYIDESNISYSTFNSYVQNIMFKYLYNSQTIGDMQNELNNQVNMILKNVPQKATDDEKILYFHDYISTHNAYDKEVIDETNNEDVQTYTAYGCLVQNVSVCQGMSDAFLLLCQKSNIDCEVVTSDEMCHAWNMVYISGKGYHLDITWDDSLNSEFYDVKGIVGHKYFLKNDTEMEGLSHYSWNSNGASSSNEYSNMYWDGVNSAIYFINSKQYYIKNNSLVMRSPETKAETVLYSFSNKICTASDSTDIAWYASTASLAYDYSSHFLVLNLGKNIVLYSLATGKTFTAYTIDKGYIAGSAFYDNTLLYDKVDKSGTQKALTQGLTLSLEYPTENLNYGDADEDTYITISDVLIIKKYLAEIIDSVSYYLCDVNNDGIVDSKDVLLLEKYLAKYDVELGK